MRNTGGRAVALAFLCIFLAALEHADNKPAQPAKQLVPVFPATREGLFYVEGEDAVSTNMATQPTLNYGCSANRTLQLSRTALTQNGASYYAEYAVYVDQAGAYELWYGGTPPGPRDEFAPSFASPVTVIVDGGAPRPLYREDVNVVERYAPAYYWVRCFQLDLSQGPHVLRFEVNAKRRLDNRYFFYLDALFVATPDLLKSAAADRTGLPARFPADPANRSVDHPFRTFEEFEAVIQANPSVIEPYIDLAEEYSLAGDYINALKVLSRAAIVFPKDERVRLLIAKNRIWRGDAKDGLDAYGIYLSLKPDALDGYEEAGKVAAWSGRYSDSEYFYVKGLGVFPGNSSLTVNMGLSQLWAGRVADAERNFAAAERQALASPEGAQELAEVYRDNGFPDRAIQTYERAISAFPDHLAFYLGEENILAAEGKEADQKKLESRIAATFADSPELQSVLATAKANRELKADRIADLEERIASDPDNLDLRDELTRVYAWAGRTKDAAKQLESILAARFAFALADSDAAMEDVHDAQFAAAALLEDNRARMQRLAELAAKAQAAQAAAQKAVTDLAAREKADAAAQVKAAASAGNGAAGNGEDAQAAAGRANLVAACRNALAGLSAAMDDLSAETARASALVDRVADLKSAIDAAVDRGRDDEKDFEALIKGSGWKFDAAAASADLEASASAGEQLAYLDRGRLLLADNPAAAASALKAVSSPALKTQRDLAGYLLAVRQDTRSIYKAAVDPAGAPPPLAAAAQAVSDISALAAPSATAGELPAEDAAEAAIFSASSGTLSKALDEVLADEAKARVSLASAQTSLASTIRAASIFEDRRLARAWYDFESQSLDLRAELGSYYEQLDLSAEAMRQYRHVLALDPGNIRAMYSLAQAEEKSGDWSAAAALYRSVDEADSTYQSAASRYNGIARLHASSYDSQTSVIADLNGYYLHSTSASFLPLSSTFALKPEWGMDSILDRLDGYPAFADLYGGIEASVRLLNGPHGEGLTLRPSATLIGTSADFDAYGATTFSPEQFLDAVALYSKGGLGLDWNSGPWNGTADYSYGPVPETVNPAEPVLFEHRFTAGGSAYYPLGGIFRYLAPRFSVFGSYIPADDNNVRGNALLELIPAFRLSDTPWANLGIPMDVLYEDSLIPKSTPYYAADQCLTVKGGLLWQSTWAGKNDSAVSLSVEGLGGIYISSLLYEPDRITYPYMYALARVDWIKTAATYSLAFEVTDVAPSQTIPEYWSVALTFGISARQPDLLAK
jgi:tetratricopeptide (TPR) repeat protein